MSLPYEVLNEHIVFCPGCKHHDENRRIENGIFDHGDLVTYFCTYCGSYFGCCTTCGRSSPGGQFCTYCTPKSKRPAELNQELMPGLSLKREDFVYEYAGHWLYKPNNRVYNLPIDFLD